MKNLWPSAFEENDKASAKSFLEEQSKLLPKLTGDVVHAEVSPLGEVDAVMKSVQNEFAYRFDIIGKFLDGYRFNVFLFSHDITLYPVSFRLDEKIANELGISRHPINGCRHSVATPGELEAFIGKVLSSNRVKDVVGSIIRLSK